MTPYASDISRRLSLKRSALMLSCAAAALAAQPARAQLAPPTGAFRGSIGSTSGTVTRTPLTNTTETITVGSPTATINWTPTDTAQGGGTIDFLPNGNVATFTSAPGVTDYTVLNRIVPTDATRPIGLNGQVISTLQGTSATGGRIWFYSPGGIVVGATAVFDVGSLLLTTNDVSNLTTNGGGFSATFTGAASSTSKIQIMPGAQINALEQNSYVALVAPRIEQGGIVKVDGSAAYVAADQLTMTMNQGLFDIQVDVGGGTDDANGIVHTGSTTGGATSALSGTHKIYMVAVPKNQALTMLLGGDVGFDSTVAGYENGQIVLSSGLNVNDTGGGIDTNSDNIVDANIDIGPGNYLSDLAAFARGDITAFADSGSIAFAAGLTFNSSNAASTGNVTLDASNGFDLTVGGDVSLLSTNNNLFSETSIYADGNGLVDIGGNLTMVSTQAPGDGGDASITAGGSLSGGEVNIAGTVNINADGGYANPATFDNIAADASGGDINITAYDGGAITTGGLTLNANAYGQSGIDENGGNGSGGYVYINADSGGSITVTGDLTARAQGSGGNVGGSGTLGGTGNGGYVDLNVGDGTISVTGNGTLSASAWGGSVSDGGNSGAQAGGDADGGSANINAYGAGSITIDGSSDVRAEAYGGDGQAGGTANGGTAGIEGIDGTIALGSSNYISAQGFGGDASIGSGGNGGSGAGGFAFIQADLELGNIEVLPSQGTITGGNAIIDASGTGGSGGAGNGDNIAAGTGGAGDGGIAYLLTQVDGASLTLGSVSLVSQGVGGVGGSGGSGQAGGSGGIGSGGIAQLGLFDAEETRASTGSMTVGALNVRPMGIGGNGGSSASGLGGTGGLGFGGDALIEVPSGSFVSGNVELNAIGNGGTGGTEITGGLGGDGWGGFAETSVSGEATTGGLILRGSGFGGDGGAGIDGGAGGAGSGGSSSIDILAGGTLASGDILNRSLGLAGDGGNGTTGFGGDGGLATGGTNFVTVAAGGSLTATSYTGTANAPSGYDFDPDLNAFVSTGGNGGSGASGRGAGGSATSGSGYASISGTAAITNNFIVTSFSRGGDGSSGGNATGGELVDRHRRSAERRRHGAIERLGAWW